jgi:thiol-disulfide isomerase/thioredoxin
MSGPWLISYIALWILFLVVAIVLISVLRNLGVLYQSMSQLVKVLPNTSKLTVGELLPRVTLHDAHGEPLQWRMFEGVSAAFTVISPGCGPCRALMQQFAQNDLRVDPENPIQARYYILISLGDIASTSELVSGMNGREGLYLLFDVNREVEKDWGVSSTPTTIVVDSQMKIVRQISGAKVQNSQAIDAERQEGRLSLRKDEPLG